MKLVAGPRRVDLAAREGGDPGRHDAGAARQRARAARGRGPARDRQGDRGRVAGHDVASGVLDGDLRLGGGRDAAGGVGRRLGDGELSSGTDIHREGETARDDARGGIGGRQSVTPGGVGSNSRGG